MKKLTVLAAIAVLTAVCASAQSKENLLAEKGYVGAVGGGVSSDVGFGAEVFTSHGYSFGNGLWMGGGIGLSLPSAGTFMQLYTGAKYTFMPEDKVSPFLSGKIGIMTTFEDNIAMFNPAFGVDLSKFSIYSSVNFWLLGYRTYSVGFYWNFK